MRAPATIGARGLQQRRGVRGRRVLLGYPRTPGVGPATRDSRTFAWPAARPSSYPIASERRRRGWRSGSGRRWRKMRTWRPESRSVPPGVRCGGATRPTPGMTSTVAQCVRSDRHDALARAVPSCTPDDPSRPAGCEVPRCAAARECAQANAAGERVLLARAFASRRARRSRTLPAGILVALEVPSLDATARRAPNFRASAATRPVPVEHGGLP